MNRTLIRSTNRSATALRKSAISPVFGAGAAIVSLCLAVVTAPLHSGPASALLLGAALAGLGYRLRPGST